MALFEDKAPKIMADLLKDFPEWGPEDAAADLGNAGHECAGFTDLIEFDGKDGGRGGVGWYQWTGPRRRAYEAYCNRNGLDKFSDTANYAFHFVELKGLLDGYDESRTINAVKTAVGLEAKTIAFEKAYERAGVKHYDRRYAYAKRALDAWNAVNPTSNTKQLIIETTVAGGAIGAIILVLQFFGLI